MARVLLLLSLLGLAGAEAEPGEQEPPQKPGEKPLTREEIEELRREIEKETRSSLELVFDWNGDSGDLNNQLRLQGYRLRFNFKRGSSKIELAARRAGYATSEAVVEESGTGGSLAVRTTHSDRVDSHFEVGATWFSNDTWSVTGQAALTVKPSDKARFSVTFSRNHVQESMLSAVGLRPVEGPFAGQLVGAVRDNRASLSGSYGLPARLDVYGEAALGLRTGENVSSNWFARGAGGVGWNAVVSTGRRLSFLRLSVFGDYFGFSEDRLGYGGASLLYEDGRHVPLDTLGSDGISPIPSEDHPGVGGYFSPARYSTLVGRMDARGRARPSIDYELSAFFGTQSFTGASRRAARGVSFTLRLEPHGRLSLPLTYGWDDFGPFSQQKFRARLVLLL